MEKRGRFSVVGAVVAALSLVAVGPVAATVTNAAGTTTIGNTGTSTRYFVDGFNAGQGAIGISSGGSAYLQTTPGGRQAAWYGLPSGTTTPVALTGLPGSDGAAGTLVAGNLAVVVAQPSSASSTTTVAWENLDGTGAGSGPAVPTNTSGYTSPGSASVTAAPGGWVTEAQSSATGAGVRLIQVSTSGAITDLGPDPFPGAFEQLLGGPNGVVALAYSGGGLSAIYVPYAAPRTPVTLALPASPFGCAAVLSANAVCYGGSRTTGTLTTDALVPLTGAAATTVTLPSGVSAATGTANDAMWVTSTGTIAYQPWAGGTVTTVSSGPGLPANTALGDLATTDTTLLFTGGTTASTAGVASLIPPATTSTLLASSSLARIEASQLALGPGRAAWADDAPATGTTTPLWSRSLSTNTATNMLVAGTSASLIATDASTYSNAPPNGLHVSGNRTLYLDLSGNLVLTDGTSAAPTVVAKALTTASGQSVDPIGTLSGSRVLYDNPSNAYAATLYDAVTGTTTVLSSIPAGSAVSLWGNYVAWTESDGSVWRMDLASGTSTNVLAAPASANQCNTSGVFVSGDYVAWSENCYAGASPGPIAGYRDMTTGTAAVDLSTSASGFPVALSGSYVALVPGGAANASFPQTLTAMNLASQVTTTVGTASGAVALDGSAIAWIDQTGVPQAAPLTAVANPPRFLGDPNTPGSYTVGNGTWNAEWDTSALLTSCSVNITSGSTAVDTLPCNSADMAVGDAVVSWNGTSSSGAAVSSGTYTATLTASNSAGALESPTGGTTTLSASIAVTGGPPPAGSSTTSVSVSPTSPVVGQTATLTATVTSSKTPVGKVTFTPTGSTTPISSACTNVALSATSPYQASCNTAYTAAGAQSVTATFTSTSSTVTGSSGTASFAVSAPPGATSYQSASSTTPGGSATATNAGVTATASGGEGTVTVAQYASNPVGAPSFKSSGSYFDVSLSSGSTFTSVTVKNCNLMGGTTLYWWNPAGSGAWQSVVGDPGPITTAGPCITVTLTGASSPNLTQLGGTVFAVGTPPPNTRPPANPGYHLVATDGGVFSFDAPFHGSMGNVPLNKPVVGMAADTATGGYWMVASDGGVFAFDAPFHGSTGDITLNKPVVGMAADTATGGYWMVASDGGVFNFDAPFHGSTGAMHLTSPIVGMAATAHGGGYWLVAADGTVYPFGTALQHGPYRALNLNHPIVGIAADPATGGYWLVASDGGVFAFNAPFEGSTGDIALNKPIVGMAADTATGGYWLDASDGGVFSFNAPFDGSMGAVRLNQPVVGMAAG
ncbi:MAG: beta strand repeat-containing protein [Acidimicrobiales bacterium]